MEDAVARVASIFPFLTGMLIPSTQRDGISNALEVRPSTAAELEKYPILVTQHHTEPTALTVDGRFNPALLPFPIVYPPHNPSPVLRVKANVIGDELLLVVSFDHRVVDGSGIFRLTSIFNAFCCDLDAQGPFPTAQEQEETRKHIEEVASTATPKDLIWTTFPPQACEEEISMDPSQVPVNFPHLLDAEKIKMLHEACNAALQSVPEKYKKDIPKLSLSPDLIVIALVSICSSRARLQAFPDKKELSLEMFMVENLRKPLNLHRGYIGNTIVGNQSPSDGSAPAPPEVLQNIHVPESLSSIGPEDIWRLCNVAQTLQEHSGRLDKEYAEGMLATMARERDWASFRPGWGVDFLVSNIRSAKPYIKDFGPLGELKLFDLCYDTTPGYCWIMPNLPSDSLSPTPCWRLRWILERAATECLSSDPLLKWASIPSIVGRDSGVWVR
jgi:hypothetical protein